MSENKNVVLYAFLDGIRNIEKQMVGYHLVLFVDLTTSSTLCPSIV